MKKVFCIFITLSGFLVLPAFSQNDSIYIKYLVADTLSEDFGFFESNELLEIALRFNITYYKRKRSDKEYLDAILTYFVNEKDSINKFIRVRPRGDFRRTFCEFPPLLLIFKMEDSLGGEFNNINKLKIVTHC